MQCQNCNTEEMGKGTVPMARQRGRLTILVYQISAMVCSSFEFYILEEPVKVRIRRGSE